MNTQSIVKGGLIALAVLGLEVGVRLTDTNVYVGGAIIVVALALPFVREILKGKLNK